MAGKDSNACRSSTAGKSVSFRTASSKRLAVPVGRLLP